MHPAATFKVEDEAVLAAKQRVDAALLS